MQELGVSISGISGPGTHANFRAGPGYPRLANYTKNKSKKWNQHVK